MVVYGKVRFLTLSDDAGNVIASGGAPYTGNVCITDGIVIRWTCSIHSETDGTVTCLMLH